MRRFLLLFCGTLMWACGNPVGPAERWIVECYDVWGRETTVAFEDYDTAYEWMRDVETRKPGGPNPLICDIYTAPSE